MKTIISVITFIAAVTSTVTLLVSISASFSHKPFEGSRHNGLNTNQSIVRVIVVGKRMTAQQKSEYDAQRSIAAQ